MDTDAEYEKLARQIAEQEKSARRDVEQEKLARRVDELQTKVALFDKIMWVCGALAVIFGCSGAFGIQLLNQANSEITKLQKDIATLSDWKENLAKAKQELNVYEDTVSAKLRLESAAINAETVSNVRAIESSQDIIDAMVSKALAKPGLAFSDIFCTSVTVGPHKTLLLAESTAGGDFKFKDISGTLIGQWGILTDATPFLRIGGLGLSTAVELSSDSNGGLVAVNSKMTNSPVAKMATRSDGSGYTYTWTNSTFP